MRADEQQGVHVRLQAAPNKRVMVMFPVGVGCMMACLSLLHALQ